MAVLVPSCQFLELFRIPRKGKAQFFSKIYIVTSAKILQLVVLVQWLV